MPYCCGYYHRKIEKCSKCGGVGKTITRKQPQATQELPYDFIKADPMPPYCLEWLKQRGISEDDISKYGLFYAWHTLVDNIMYPSRLIIPVLRKDKTFSFFQARALFNENPKYVSAKNIRKEYFVCCEHNESNTIYVVEDALSAIRLAKYVNVVALLGNSLTDTLMGTTLMKYDHLKIWLDDDAGGRTGIYKILSTYNGWFESIEVLSSDKEPKWCSDDEIIEITHAKRL